MEKERALKKANFKLTSFQRATVVNGKAKIEQNRLLYEHMPNYFFGTTGCKPIFRSGTHTPFSACLIAPLTEHSIHHLWPYGAENLGSRWPSSPACRPRHHKKENKKTNRILFLVSRAALWTFILASFKKLRLFSVKISYSFKPGACLYTTTTTSSSFCPLYLISRALFVLTSRRQMLQIGEKRKKEKGVLSAKILLTRSRNQNRQVKGEGDWG